MNTTLSPSYAKANARSVSLPGTQLVLALIIAVGVLVHSYNMFGYPLFLGDEGIYMSQSWAVLNLGQLTPYTYWYDHAPAGWLLISVWTVLTGGFSSFGLAADSGRALMLVLHTVSLLLLFRLTLRLSGSLVAAATAGLLFALSPLSVVYGRMVLLDNIMVFWTLLSVAWLIRHEGEIWPLIGSATCFAIAVLTKEVALLLLPAYLFALWTIVERYHARFARTGWIFVTIGIISIYPLFAALKKELLNVSFSSPLAGNSGDVTLLGAVRWQLSRSGGMPWTHDSDFYRALTEHWLRLDPWLLGLGCIALLWSLVRGGNQRRVVALMGLCTLGGLVTGGAVLQFYILAALPWIALAIGLLIADLAQMLSVPGFGLLLGGGAIALSGHNLYQHQEVFTVDLTNGQREALAWVREHVPPQSHVIIDDDIWVDLHHGSVTAPSFPYAHSHWKAALDPSIWIDFFDDNWKNVDYLVLTPGLDKIWAAQPERFPWRVYQQSIPVAQFGSGNARVEVRKVLYPGVSVKLAMERAWLGFKTRNIVNGQVRGPGGVVDAHNQAGAMLMAVWMGDREVFASLWAKTKATMLDQRGLLRSRSGSKSGVSDADTDAAMALLMAKNRWGDESYGRDGRRLVVAIRNHYVVKVGGKPYIVAGDWAIDKQQIIVTPAGFSPAAYHLFAADDPGFDWWYLLDTGYDLLDQVSSGELGTERSAGLPPAYIGIERESGALDAVPAAAPPNSEVFDTYAAQIYWRLGLDARLHNDGRAAKFLRASNFLSNELGRDGKLGNRYSHDGRRLNAIESFTLYSAILPKLVVEDQQAADTLYALKIAPQYTQDRTSAVWGSGQDIDAQRLAFIGTGLYGQVINDDWSNKAAPLPRLVPKPNAVRILPL